MNKFISSANFQIVLNKDGTIKEMKMEWKTGWQEIKESKINSVMWFQNERKKHDVNHQAMQMHFLNWI